MKILSPGVDPEEGIRRQDVHWWVEAFMRAWLG